MQLDVKEKEKLNLEMLISKYCKSGAAAKGRKALLKEIKSPQKGYLKRMLRDHEDEEIDTQEEINFRDNVDELLKFYSILELALLSGYISQPLPEKLQKEILMILTNQFVSLYYQEFYPLLLPQLLIDSLGNKKIQEPIGSSEYFIQLLLINKLIDNDVSNFLWLLDSGIFEDYDLDDFKKTLGSVKEIQDILEGGENIDQIKVSVFWGMLKYTSFIEKYERLLKRAGTNELLASALWHFQGYWFEKINKKLKKAYWGCIKLLEESSIRSINYSLEEHDLEQKKIITELSTQGNRSIESISFTIDSQHGKALLKYHKSHLHSRIRKQLVLDAGFFLAAFLNREPVIKQSELSDPRYSKMITFINTAYPDLIFSGFDIDRREEDKSYLNIAFKNNSNGSFLFFHFTNQKISLQIVKQVRDRLYSFVGSINWKEDTNLPVGIIVDSFHDIEYALPTGSSQNLLSKYESTLPDRDDMKLFLQEESF